MSLSADDIRAIIREELQAVGRPPGWVLPPKGSDWSALTAAQMRIWSVNDAKKETP